jgi:translation initiation factor 5
MSTNEERLLHVTARTGALTRHTMPALVTKVVGAGGGIRTNLVNLREVASCLARPPEVLMKFLGRELGAITMHDQHTDQFRVNGKYTPHQLQDVVFDFIDRFVLCGRCCYPECLPRFDSSGVVVLSCNACGADTPVEDHRVAAQLKALLQSEGDKEA